MNTGCPVETALIVILSCHPSLASWLDYYPEHLSGRQFFERVMVSTVYLNHKPRPAVGNISTGRG